MGISAREAAVVVQGLFYLVFTISAVRQFARAPGQVRFHILLIFAGFTGSLILREISLRLFASESAESTAQMLFLLSFVSEFSTLYGAFLLARDLTTVGPWLKWVGIAILVLSAGSIVAILTRFPNATLAISGVRTHLLPDVLFLAFFAGLLFLVARFWRSSVLASGASQSRLQWLGAGSTFACLAVALTPGNILSGGSPALSVLEHLLLLLTGVMLYLGCSPPGWLRRAWMLPELEEASQYCNALILGAPMTDPGETQHVEAVAITRMLQHAMNGFGALVGTVQLWNEERNRLEVAASILPSEEGFAADAKSTSDEALAAVFRARQPLLKPISARKWPFLQRQIDAGVVMVAPLKRGEQTLGVLGICCEHAPDLDTRDLERLQLFADQITCLLTCHFFQGQMAAFQALRSEQASKDEFIALIAHDLRTPLTVLKGRLQLVRRQLLKAGQAEAAETVARLDGPYNRLSQLITTLLDVSYIDTGRLQLLRHAVDLVGVVRKVVEASQERKITLEVASGGPLLVLADAGRLEQVLGNVLANARKYSPVDSAITVRVERCAGDSEEALLSVRDLGIGIPAEDQPRLFQRWFRANNNTAQNYTGLGLGLYISREIITRHGGRLWVESSGIAGEGSTFCFTLPVIPPEQVREAGNRVME